MIHVLYIDDETSLLTVTKYFLEEESDLKVDVVDSAEEGLELLQPPHQYDAIISDYDMPDMDGIELLNRIRTMEKDIPFIIFTGKSREDVVIEALNNGVDFYLQKGGDPRTQFTELINAIRHLVRRKRAESDALRSETRLSLFLDQLSCPAFIKDPSFRYIYVNSPFLKYLDDISRDDIIGMTDQDMSDFTHQDQSSPPDKEVISRNIPLVSREYGRERLLERVRFPLPFEDGSSGIGGFIRQVITRNDGIIPDEKNILQSIAESVEEMILIFDGEYKISYANPAAVREISLSSGELTGRDIDEMGLPDDIARRWKESMDTAIQTEKEQKIQFRFPSGTWADLTVISVRTSGTTLPMVMGIIKDVSERKRYETTIHETSHKVRLLSSISRHDILNQVNIISLISESLIRKNEKNPEISDAMKDILNATERIQDQIEFMKDYYELGVSDPVWHTVHDLVDQAAHQILPERIILSNTTGTLEILADPLLIRAFYNLFENAVQHGETVTRISVTTREETGKKAVISISDDGLGIPDDMKDAIFKCGVGSHTGLGLYLVRQILAITDISIRETGIHNHGATFEIVVPEEKWRIKQT